MAAPLERAKQNVSAAAAEAVQSVEQEAPAAATADKVEHEEQKIAATPLDQAKQEGTAVSAAHRDPVPAAAAVHKVKEQADPADQSANENIESRHTQKAEETGSLRQVG